MRSIFGGSVSYSHGASIGFGGVALTTTFAGVFAVDAHPISAQHSARAAKKTERAGCRKRRLRRVFAQFFFERLR
jgi:hypothetical protein